jgi:hypothetical protein
MNPASAEVSVSGRIPLRFFWPWSSVHDDAGSINHAPVTPSGLSVDRVLLPAAPPHSDLNPCE